MMSGKKQGLLVLPDLRSLPAEAERILPREFFSTVASLGTLSSRRINKGFGIAVGLRTGILGPAWKKFNLV